VYIREENLPQDKKLRDQTILSIFGSPDPRQINGLGGADPLTSKLAIIRKSDRPEADIDYTFAQVGIERDAVDYSWNCGNISAGVGPFAIDEGLVRAVEPVTTVRIFNTNTRKLIIAEVPVRDGKAQTEGNYAIDGVPGTGAAITLRFVDPAGGATGKLLPTAHASDKLSLDSRRRIEATIVDAGNLYVFVLARDLGLQGTESPQELESKIGVMKNIEKIRNSAADLLLEKALIKERILPKLAFVNSPPEKGTIDLVSRIVSSDRMHKAYAVTGAIATAAAVLIDGSTVHQVVNKERVLPKVIKIGHAAGTMEATVDCTMTGNELIIKTVSIQSTARRIMDGFVYCLPHSIVSSAAI
jgi:2-methylaconitate cis-trans-isomerase PrpF